MRSSPEAFWPDKSAAAEAHSFGSRFAFYCMIGGGLFQAVFMPR
jgi:hypothetical protein